MTHPEKLRVELDKVPEGCPYAEAPNYPEIKRLLDEGTPLYQTVDWASEPSITVTDVYTKEGKHVRSTVSTENGKVIEEWGPTPSKDLSKFLVWWKPMWDEFWGQK